MILHLVRHTKPDIASGTCYGQLDLGLPKSFEEDALQVFSKLKGPYDRVLSSPLERCLSLAKKFNSEVEIHKNLVELDFGDWEGLSWDEIPRKDIDFWGEDYVKNKPHNGESLLDMYFRIKACVDRLNSGKNEKLLLFTHAGVIRCIWCYISGHPLENFFDLEVDYGDVFELNLLDSLPTLSRI